MNKETAVNSLNTAIDSLLNLNTSLQEVRKYLSGTGKTLWVNVYRRRNLNLEIFHTGGDLFLTKELAESRVGKNNPNTTWEGTYPVEIGRSWEPTSARPQCTSLADMDPVKQEAIRLAAYLYYKYAEAVPNPNIFWSSLIQTIKHIRTLTNCGVSEAKQLVDWVRGSTDKPTWFKASY